MTLQEQLKVVAVYDGCRKREKWTNFYDNVRDHGNGCHIDDMQYQTSFDWSMPVARKVRSWLIDEEIRTRGSEGYKFTDWVKYIDLHTLKYSEMALFNALFEAITFINENQKRNEKTI